MTRKQAVWFIVIAFFVGALGSIFFNRVAIPYLSTVKGFGWTGKLQSSAPIVITRREEVRLNEGVNLIELVKQAETITVSIHSGGANSQFLGNGVIITSDGLVMTTKEVVGNASQVTVVANDGTVYPALVRAQDPKSPLVVLSTAGRDMPVAQFSDASNMQAAQRIFALGRTNQEFNREFVSGFISKTLANNLQPDLGRNTEAFFNTVITDAAITGGDYLGSPVVNLQGLVIGIVVSANGQIFPAEYIDGAMKSYLADGKIRRPFIGMEYLDVSKTTAKIRNTVAGAHILSVDTGSPAAQAGLAANDVILQVNGQKVEDSTLEQLLNYGGSNDMRLLVRRGAEQREATLKPVMR